VANPELMARVNEAKQRLRAARLRTQQCKEGTEKLVATTIALFENYDQLEQRARRKLANQPRGSADKKSNHDRLGMLPAMKEALANVERVVMVPSNDPALRKLKSDLRSAVANLQFRKIVSRGGNCA
jgi:hypothetical protein